MWSEESGSELERDMDVGEGMKGTVGVIEQRLVSGGCEPCWSRELLVLRGSRPVAFRDRDKDPAAASPSAGGRCSEVSYTPTIMEMDSCCPSSYISLS